MTLAPWLDIRPQNFLQAAESGTQMGNEISRTQLAARAQAVNAAHEQALLDQQRQEAMARQMLMRQELLQRARQAQAQQQIEQQGNQSRVLLGLAGEDRLARNADLENQARNRTIDLEGQRVDLEKERNNRLRYIKSGNGAYSFDPTTGETTQIIENTASTGSRPKPAADDLIKRGEFLLKAYPNLSPEGQDNAKAQLEEIQKSLNPNAPQFRTVTPETVSSAPILNQTPRLQPTAPQVGSIVNGGVWAGGGTLPVAAGVPTNGAALQPSTTVVPRVKPPPEAIKALISNPDKWQDFEAKYGQGSSSAFLP